MGLFGDSKAKSISKDAQKKYHPEDGRVPVAMFRAYGKMPFAITHLLCTDRAGMKD